MQMKKPRIMSGNIIWYILTPQLLNARISLFFVRLLIVYTDANILDASKVSLEIIPGASSKRMIRICKIE
ncbi:unnamed protein product [marine sediment metagenome]|uniref:Uncharacterized protein n=1 Tax=marine sediment metagenome TaxID=412755 RepID=X1Q5T5_9ZZZZ